MKKSLFVLALLLSSIAYASDDSDAYCDYTNQKAEAERLQLQSPSLVAGFGRSTTAQSNTLALGVTSSLSKYLKGRLSGQAGDTDCRLYRTVNEIQKHVNFDITDLSLTDAKVREDLFKKALTEMQKLIDQEQLRQGAGSSTKQAVETLQSIQNKFQLQLIQLDRQIAITFIPNIDDTSLSKLLSKAVELTTLQNDIAKDQSNFDNWDVSLTTGLGSDPNRGILHVDKSYTTLSFSYSFGAITRNRALGRSADSYSRWVSTNQTGPINLGRELREQISRAIDSEQKTLTVENSYKQNLESNLESIQNNDTLVSHAFAVQLKSELISVDVEINASQARLINLQAYLDRNFNGG